MVGLRAFDHSGTQHILDLKQNVGIPINYQFSDFRDLKTKGDYNKEFTLPPTTANIAYFGDYFDVNLDGSFNPKRKVDAILEVDTVPVLSGSLQLLSVSMMMGAYSEFKVRVLGQVSTLGRAISDKTLADYDLSAFAHELTVANAIDAFDDTGIVITSGAAGATAWGFFSDTTGISPANSALTLPTDVLVPVAVGTSLLAAVGPYDDMLITMNVTFTSSDQTIGDTRMSIWDGVSTDFWQLPCGMDNTLGKFYVAGWDTGETTAQTGTYAVKLHRYGATLDVYVDNDLKNTYTEASWSATSLNFYIVATGSAANDGTGLIQFGSVLIYISPLVGIVKYGYQDFGQLWRIDGDDAYRNFFDSSRPIHFENFRPYIKVKDVLDIILDEEGFVYESTFLNGAVFGKLWMLAYDPEFYADFIPSRDAYAKVSVSPNSTILGTKNTIPFVGLGTGFEDNEGLFETLVTTDDPATSCYNTQAVDVQDNIAYQINVSAKIISTGTQNITFELWERIDASNSTSIDTEIIASVAGTTTETFSFSAYNGGNPIYITTISDAASIGTSVIAGSDSFFEVDDINITSIATFDFEEHLSKIKAKDVFNSVIKMFNLLVIPNRQDENYLKIEPYDDYINAGSVVDWSKKINLAQTVTHQPLAPEEKQNIKLTYTKSDDILSVLVQENADRVYGEYELSNDTNDFATGNQKIVVPAYNTPLNAIPNDSGIYIPKLYNNQINKSKHGLRFFQDQGEYTFDTAVEMRDLAGNQVTVPRYNGFGHYEIQVPTLSNTDLNFGVETPFQTVTDYPINTLFETYWRSYFEEYYEPKAARLKAEFLLDPTDIYNFAWNDQIWVLNSYWRLESIRYDPTIDSKASVTLLKLNLDIDLFCDLTVDSIASDNEVLFLNLDGTPATKGTKPYAKCCKHHNFVFRNLKCYRTIAQQHYNVGVYADFEQENTGKIVREIIQDDQKSTGIVEINYEEFLTMGG